MDRELQLAAMDPDWEVPTCKSAMQQTKSVTNESNEGIND